MPLLSIIIPVYNAEKTIAATLSSLLTLSRESREQSEVVLVDDGSQDNCMAIASSMVSSLAPLQVVMLRQENRGTGAARNTGLASCRGEWIFFLDADDQLVADPLPALKRHREASAVAFSISYLRNNKQRGVQRPVAILPDTHLDRFTSGNSCTVSSLVFRKQLIQEHFNEEFRYLEDWLFWIMNPALFDNMAREEDFIVVSIHVHGENKSGNYVMAGRDRVKVAEKVLERLEGTLTPKQKNNLRMQVNIGLILQNKPVRGRAFLLVPCSASLYAKLVVYTLFRNRFNLIDRYGVRTS